MGKYTVEPGRWIYCDGKPLFSIHKADGVSPVEADNLAHTVADELNKRSEALGDSEEPKLKTFHIHIPELHYCVRKVKAYSAEEAMEAMEAMDYVEIETSYDHTLENSEGYPWECEEVGEDG